MLFSEDDARHPIVVADLPAATALPYSAITDAILHDRSSLRRPFLVRVDISCHPNSGPAGSARVSRLTAAQFSAPERSADRLQPVSRILLISFRSLISCPSGSRHFGGLGGTDPSPSSPFPSILEHLSRFRDLLDAQGSALIPSVSFFCGRPMPDGAKWETLASAWWKRCRTLYVRGGDMIPLEHGVASKTSNCVVAPVS